MEPMPQGPRGGEVFIFPLLMVLGVVGVLCPQLWRERDTALLCPAEKRQLVADRSVGVISSFVVAAQEWRLHHSLGGLENLQIVLLPLPGRPCCWQAALLGTPGCRLGPPAQGDTPPPDSLLPLFRSVSVRMRLVPPLATALPAPPHASGHSGAALHLLSPYHDRAAVL